MYLLKGYHNISNLINILLLLIESFYSLTVGFLAKICSPCHIMLKTLLTEVNVGGEYYGICGGFPR